HTEKLAASLKEKFFMQQAVIEECARLFPIGEHHHGESAAFGEGRGNAHYVIQVLHNIVFEEPIAGLAQASFSTLFEDLQMKLALLKGRFRSHSYLLIVKLGFVNEACST